MSLSTVNTKGASDGMEELMYSSLYGDIEGEDLISLGRTCKAWNTYVQRMPDLMKKIVIEKQRIAAYRTSAINEAAWAIEHRKRAERAVLYTTRQYELENARQADKKAGWSMALSKYLARDYEWVEKRGYALSDLKKMNIDAKGVEQVWRERGSHPFGWVTERPNA